ncbi:MAG: UDP-N-acetylglucosamine diphosphorylase/glucosamine-1-phosphate N-acetyltransferase [Candidatus Melainabacteria bacterium RIFOXYA12_FULL_32_12]|nr:MAG: UDP-N-acetylglucosamine diphosphorylase/glucosamine-1-phosphate N-acetyltransferase [Candidatus Melainabacteria bacterium RIFOXYA2_FULL_32_9]OGI31114.1 MAG: UDP-N-acetylglucosamine diphosphorylase/glucosamine-1-phosphate N-acetyltransferase [Candidatus Melainabacteria bacterium RIFOXYA12_FULL_32_12]
METTDSIKAIVLAAGKGTRMKSSVPKVLHDMLGKTLVERVINQVLNISNISEIFVVVGHQADRVSDFIDKVYAVNACPVRSVLQQPQLGTGDAVFKVYDNLKSFNGTVLVLCGDTPLLTSETLNNFIDFHRESKAALTVLSAILDQPKNYGRIVRDSSRNVKRITEEKDANQEEKLIKEINAGVYCLEWEKVSPAFFDLTTNNEQGEYYLTDIIDWSCKKGLKVEAYTVSDNTEILGINSKSDLAFAGRLLNKRVLNNLMENGVTIVDTESTWISPETDICQDTVIFPGCYIEGQNSIGSNCVLGPNLFIGGNVTAKDNVKIFQSRVSNAVISENSSVGPFAHIRDSVEISNNVRVGNFVEIKNSVIDESSNVAHLSYIGDSTLGKNVNIGAGTITANYDPLTRKKSKTCIEDGAKIGSNSVLVAPIKIGRGANVAAGSVITKDVPSLSLAIARGQQKVIEGWVDKKLKTMSRDNIIAEN